MRKGTTSRVTAADRPYGEFYGSYSVSPENFGSTLVYMEVVVTGKISKNNSGHITIFIKRQYLS
jgi:hypothetical protein